MKYLNIEVVLGVISMSILAQHSMSVTLPYSWYVVVPLVAWAVYTLDRIADVVRDNPELYSDRHQFHQHHMWKLIAAVVFALAVAGIVAAFYFPLSYWLVALALGVLTALHYFFHFAKGRFTGIVKDLNVAVTFSLAAWCIPYLLSSHTLLVLSDGIAVFVAATLITFADVALLSILEVEADTTRGTSSLAVALGVKRSRFLAATFCLLAIGIAVTANALLGLDTPVTVTVVAMAVYYLVVMHIRIGSLTVARFVYESGLFIPFLLLLS